MISTTLMTFLLQAPPSAMTVDLIGSWDRFTKPYPLKRDKRRGPSHWRGCHTFTNITCDGDSLDVSSRDGGLKMGGNYWYFYRLDGDVEYHNPVEPSTTVCPFLPGQQVNILEVPVQLVGSDRRGSTDSIGSDVYTMDPKAKYNLPIPPSRSAAMETSKHRFSTSLSNQARRLFGTSRETYSSTSPVITPVSQNKQKEKPKTSGTTRRLIRKMRRTRSAGSESRNSHHGFISEASYVQDFNSSAAKTSISTAGYSGSTVTQNSLQPTGESLSMQMALHDGPEKQSLHSLGPIDEEMTPNAFPSRCSTSSYFTPVEQVRKALRTLSSSGLDPRPGGNAVQIIPEETHNLKYCHDGNYHDPHNSSASISSYATNLFSPGLAASTTYTDGMSPYHLSQPDTPPISEFGGDFGVRPGPNVENRVVSDVHEPSTLQFDSTTDLHDTVQLNSQVQGYMPKSKGSTLALQRLPTLNSPGGSTFGKTSSKDIVHSWNDGSNHRITALEELIDDLGYLGELII